MNVPENWNQAGESPTPFIERLTVPSGVAGLDLVHFLTWTADDLLPFDGEWSVTLSERDVAAQRCRFRTLHSAAHYALRIKDLADWTLPYEQIGERLKDGESGRALREAMRHAEAHAHEVDAVRPAGAWIPMEGGPSILDDDGVTRQFMSGMPSIEWTKDEEGAHRCSVCGDHPKIVFDWMDR